MLACAHCHTPLPETSRFCSGCGMPNAMQGSMQSRAGQPPAAYPKAVSRASHFHGGFGQAFGLDPRVAFLTVVVDTMLFGGQLATLGAGVLLSVPAGAALGLITYKAQRHWYGDDRESALVKALIVGLLTAIPTSLPGYLTIPSGVVGLVHVLRGRGKQRPLAIERRPGK